MIEIPGFETHELLYESKRCSIAVVTRLSDKQRFIVKVLSKNFLSPSEIKKFRHEFAIGQEFNSSYIIRHIDL